jgi:hypothetical protein
MTDVVITWNNVYLEAIRKTGGAPCPIARAGAMMHGAMYDAINAINPTAEPYLPGLPTPDPSTSIEAAAIHAAHTVLCSIYPALAIFLDVELKTSIGSVQTSSKRGFGSLDTFPLLRH